ncbi:MAG: coproporphyrinogen III oxidase family protein, partial [Treponemataceae bacterium]|nr:coproporphyrinogen III oxidase family protein [Treponemataceae bacterium]
MKAALYIHIPFCRSKCSYCDFFSVPCGTAAVPDGYVSALCAEIAVRAVEKGVSGWSSVYIGGGTPSLLSARQLLRIMEAVRRLAVDEGLEATLEANPADISEPFLDACAAAGVTRLSCGVQALDGAVLAGVRRRGSLDDVRRALRLISRQWRGVFSADMIAALPGQTLQPFLAGLSELLEYGPSHISLYSLSIEEGTPLAREVAEGRVPYDDDAAAALWISGRDVLVGRGFVQYEVSNFRLKDGGRECA